MAVILHAKTIRRFPNWSSVDAIFFVCVYVYQFQSCSAKINNVQKSSEKEEIN